MENKVTLYYPDKAVALGFTVSWKEMVLNLLKSRELIWRFFIREFQVKYRQSFLGISWAIIMPLLTVGFLVLLRKSRVFNMPDSGMPYFVFALIGISVFGLFSSGLTGCANSLVSSGQMVSKINFPKISLVVAAFGQAVVDLLVRFGFLLIVLIIFGIFPSWKIIFLPLIILPLGILTLGLGLVFSILTGIFRDVSNVLSIGTLFLLFLSPVLYPVPLDSWMSVWNPLSHFIVSSRELIINGHISNLNGLLFSSLLSFGVFLVAWRIFYLMESKVAEKL
ncbi:MAG: ABC transporter permease [Candidatus Aminicenantes bacterium]|nr:ABC transporter permease [Candidatus Aminicenantes bacterium]